MDRAGSPDPGYERSFEDCHRAVGTHPGLSATPLTFDKLSASLLRKRGDVKGGEKTLRRFYKKIKKDTILN
jgi:hypothetical protein